jgi:hypothetical protein
MYCCSRLAPKNNFKAWRFPFNYLDLLISTSGFMLASLGSLILFIVLTVDFTSTKIFSCLWDICKIVANLVSSNCFLPIVVITHLYP